MDRQHFQLPTTRITLSDVHFEMAVMHSPRLKPPIGPNFRFVMIRNELAKRIRRTPDPSPVSVPVLMRELGNKSLRGVS